MKITDHELPSVQHDDFSSEYLKKKKPWAFQKSSFWIRISDSPSLTRAGTGTTTRAAAAWRRRRVLAHANVRSLALKIIFFYKKKSKRTNSITIRQHYNPVKIEEIVWNLKKKNPPHHMLFLRVVICWVILPRGIKFEK